MKKRVIGICLIGTILIIVGICTFYSSNKNTFIQDGVTYALTLDGASIDSFPAKGMYRVDVECSNATGKWLYDEWKLAIEDFTSNNITCDIDFTTISQTNLNNYITSLVGQTQGDGQVLNEKATIDNSIFIPDVIFENSNYSNLANDTSYPFTWNAAEKNGTSTNKNNSTTSTITFSPQQSGYFQVCYTVSSEANFDKVTFYVDNSQIAQDSGNQSDCVYLGNLSSSNIIKVTYSKDGSSSSGNDNVMFYMQSGSYNEGIKTLDAGIRYEGKNPNNYIWFNNELWRIIGVFDENSHGQSGQNLVKIIRNNSLGGLAWSKSSSNDWSTSSLKTLLNENYYNATDGTDSGNCYGYGVYNIPSNCDYTGTGIHSTYRSMVKNVTWYLGGYSSTSATAAAFYGYERGTTVYSGRPTSTTGYIGLMYPSDYGYSVLASSCARTTNLGSYNNSTCVGESWMYGKGDEWTITPTSSSDRDLFYLSYSGYLYHSGVITGNNVRPVLYLDSSVYVVDGSGTMSDPYIIGM